MRFIKKDPLYIVGIIFLCLLTMQQTYTLIWNYEERQREQLKIYEANRIEILNEFDKNRDVTSYLVYYSITPTQENFFIEREVTLISDSEIFEPIDATWFDILRCDIFDGNWYRYWSDYETKSYSLDVKRTQKPWRYGWDLPKQYAECYIDGIVKITTQLGNKKSLAVESNKFTIWAP